MRAFVPVALAAVALLAAPAVASADVVFDTADADELASVLADASDEQGVCYGWNVQVSGTTVDESVGSNKGAGVPIDDSCGKFVRLDVFITWTSESSESEDSASYDLVSSPGGPGRSDMDALGLDLDELSGENPDVPLAKMISALPLLAADKGMTTLVAATPDTAEPSADAQLTDDPGSDWWRNNGGKFLWGGGLLVAGGVFAWWVLRNNRGRERLWPRKETIPDTVPEEFYADPDPTPALGTWSTTEPHEDESSAAETAPAKESEEPGRRAAPEPPEDEPAETPDGESTGPASSEESGGPGPEAADSGPAGRGSRTEPADEATDSATGESASAGPATPAEPARPAAGGEHGHPPETGPSSMDHKDKE